MNFNVTQAGIEAAQVIAEMKAEGKELVFSMEDENGKALTIAEMIGTDDGAREFVEKITYDLETGREAVPLVYPAIYSTKTDPNFPMALTEKSFGRVQVVFLEKFEGGEIKFGTLAGGREQTVRFHTWATGVEYDEDIVEYNQTWRVSDIGEAFGEAYNKILNHLHLYPIISASYTTTGGGLSAQKTAQQGDLSNDGEGAVAQLIAFSTDIVTTLQNALRVLPRGSVLLINSWDRIAIEQAISADMLPDLSPGVVKRKLNSNSFVEYDGDSAVVGGIEYTYAGVTQGTAFLLVPKRQFVEYVKHDLRVDSGDGDLSRLILAQVVGRTRRAVLAGVAGRDGAVKVALA